MAKTNRNNKPWKSSEIQVKKDSKGLLWVVLDDKKVKLPKDITSSKLTLSQAESFLGLDKSNSKNKKDYSKEEKEQILNDVFLQIKLKDLSLRRTFSKDNPNRPVISRVTFYDWINESEDLLNHYARACEVRADNIFDEMLDIADCEDNDITEDLEGTPRVNNDIVQRDRLRIETRKWVLGRMNPRKYGDKTDITSNGETIQTPARILTKQEAKELFKDLDNDY